MDKETKQTLLRQYYPFWDHLEEEEQGTLVLSCVERPYKKGELVHRLEDPCKGAILLLEGQLRMYIVSEEGREVTLFRVRKEEICVLAASCLLDAIAFDMMIEAVEDSRALVLPTPVLRPIMEENPYVGLYMYRTATERFSDVMWSMQQILFMGIDQRVASLLWDEMLHQGPEISMTHDGIARLIGSAREVVSKVLKYLSEDGVVALGRGKVRVLDKEKLKKIASGSSAVDRGRN